MLDDTHTHTPKTTGRFSLISAYFGSLLDFSIWEWQTFPKDST